MHSNQCQTDIQASICLNLFDRNRVRETALGLGRQRTACLGLRHYIDRLRKRNSTVLRDDRPVQMLTTLNGKVYRSAFVQRNTLILKQLKMKPIGEMCDFY